MDKLTRFKKLLLFLLPFLARPDQYNSFSFVEYILLSDFILYNIWLKRNNETHDNHDREPFFFSRHFAIVTRDTICEFCCIEKGRRDVRQETRVQINKKNGSIQFKISIVLLHFISFHRLV